MNNDKYQICANCVMDTSDSKITFNNAGVCEHCSNFYNNIEETWLNSVNSLRENKLKNIANKIKIQGVNAKYDCILGISGGTDSSYMLHYIVTELKLRPLVFHVDGGWNTKSAVKNIYNMTKKLDFDLHVKVIDWEEMRLLQLAYFKSGLSNIDTPQDQAFFATLYHYANKHNIKYIFNGGNISTENVVMPIEWMYFTTDLRLLKDIVMKFIGKPLKKFELTSALYHKLHLRYFRGIQVIKALDYIPYIKEDAVKTLKSKYGYESFRNKHAESSFTKFYEGYWLPTRFGFDTRRITYSSRIVTGQMSREEAINSLKEPALNQTEIKNEFNFVAKKLRISENELRGYLTIPKKTYKDYKNISFVFKIATLIFRLMKGDTSNAKR
jgi:N-acetyl sugar amidotransferase